MWAETTISTPSRENRVWTSNPQTVWPLWPGCAILVTGLSLVRFSVSPLLIPASFVGFALADLQAGLPLSSIVWFIPGNIVEVLISALGLRYCFDGVRRCSKTEQEIAEQLSGHWSADHVFSLQQR